MAARYSIIIGSSHAEPMLRNNVGEWNSQTMGHFNYITNKATVYRYWEDRVKESRDNDVIYTLGMRGVHDSGIEGVNNVKEAVPLLTRIMTDQRNLLTKYIDSNIHHIPQAFTAYKEVLTIYDNGLQIPEDVTLVWPDDNYGYVQRLNNDTEKNRPGGSGVYYHASYWGRPHDYLWLSSTHPALIREEMLKAYENKSDRLWVLNVGDIKPLEYNMSLFLDMAYNIVPFSNRWYMPAHMVAWYSMVFGEKYGQHIGGITWKYYQLAFERRPEFMGWSQTEPTTPTTYTNYNHFYYGDEAQQRIHRYEELEEQVKNVLLQIAAPYRDAFYELVYYPVMGASLINKKFLHRDKAYYYAKQHRISAHDYVQRSKDAYAAIATETDYYNNKLAAGKWKGMMSMNPRKLPVFDAPEPVLTPIDRSLKWNISPEGYDPKDSVVITGTKEWLLPAFNALVRRQYFVDIFLCDSVAVQWKAIVSDSRIVLSHREGILLPQAGKNEKRIRVHIDWSKLPAATQLDGHIIFEGGHKKIRLGVTAFHPGDRTLANFNGGIEHNGVISLFGSSYTARKDMPAASWYDCPDLGHTGKALMAIMTGGAPVTDTARIKALAARVEYSIHTFTACAPLLHVYTLPTHPLNNNYGMRYGVSVDNGAVQVMDYKTVGRSEEWKQQVLRNSAVRTARLPWLPAGRHTIQLYVIDPGVVLDRLTVDLGGLRPAYSVIPETKKAP
jgi:hypothetical protein